MISCCRKSLTVESENIKTWNMNGLGKSTTLQKANVYMYFLLFSDSESETFLKWLRYGDVSLFSQILINMSRWCYYPKVELNETFLLIRNRPLKLNVVLCKIRVGGRGQVFETWKTEMPGRTLKKNSMRNNELITVINADFGVFTHCNEAWNQFHPDTNTFGTSANWFCLYTN